MNSNEMRPPENSLIHESSTGSLWVEDGIVISTNNRIDVHTLEGAKEKVILIRKITGGVRRPLLVDITKVRSISREARDYYKSEAGIQAISALALLTGSKLSTMIGNFFIGFNKIPLPMKMFAEADEAKKWLKKFAAPRPEPTANHFMHAQPGSRLPCEQFPGAMTGARHQNAYHNADV